jgi:hypothetical protein
MEFGLGRTEKDCHMRIVDVEGPDQPGIHVQFTASCRPASSRARARAWRRSRQ